MRVRVTPGRVVRRCGVGRRGGGREVRGGGRGEVVTGRVC